MFVCPTPAPHPVILKMIYDDTAQDWIKDVINDFNGQNNHLCGTTVTIQAIPMSSEQAMQRMLDGKLKPDIWIPASSIWLSMLNEQWNIKNGTTSTPTSTPTISGNDLVSTSADDSPSLLSSPIVIAMWQSQAKALGWPTISINWSDIPNMISDPKSLITQRHLKSEWTWGKFHFGNTNPEYSNGALDAIIGMTYAGACNENTSSDSSVTPTCKKSGLTVDDVNSSNVKQLVTKIENSAVYYSSSTSYLADQMFSHGLTYLNAIAVEERLVVQANDKKKYPNLPDKVIAMYPGEGTTVADYPFAILQGISNVRNQAAQNVRDFLLSASEQTKALQYGFRPTHVNGVVGAPVDGDHGVDATQPGGSLFVAPDPSVGLAIQASWIQERRPFDVMLVADTSSTMNIPIDNIPKIDGAKTGLEAFVGLMQDSDQLGLTTFSDHADVLYDITPLLPKRQDLLTSIKSISAVGGVQLFDTIGQEFKRLQQLPSTPIRAMIVLSNQSDTQSNMNLSQLMSLITPPSDQDLGQKIRIFTIAYGRSADISALTQIAQQTGGQMFNVQGKNVQDVYQQIAQDL
jgi:Ca-activated chloride channel family protein